MKSGDQLIYEFSNITFDYIFEGYNCCDKVFYEEIGEIEFYNEFDTVFQKKFRRHSNHSDDYIILNFKQDEEYFAYLNNLRLNFYEEINLMLEEDTFSFKVLNTLLNYKSRFKELLLNYSDEKLSFCDRIEHKNIGESEYKTNKIVKTEFDDGNCSPNPLYSSRSMDSFLTCQTKTIELIIPFLDEKIELLKTFPREQYSIQSPISIKASIKIKPSDKESFELNPEHFDSKLPTSEKLHDFKNLLFQYGYIEQIDFRDFSHVFINQPITQPIRWLGTPGELYYLIKNLYEKSLIVRFKNYWSIACKCFLAYDKKHILITPYYLQRCKAPKRGEQLRKLNSILDTLQ
jgi:hypothetical protein